MQIVEQGVLCEGIAGTSRAVAAFPAVTVLESGELLGFYRIGPTKDSAGSVTEVRRSTDGGRTWSEPVTPFADLYEGVQGSLQVVYATPLGGTRLIACALWVDREEYPGKPLFNADTEGCLPMKILVADSQDDGQTWTEWREVMVTEDVGPPSLTNPIMRLRDGRLIVSIETNKTYFDGSQWFQRVVYCESDDNGATWTLPRTVCQDPTGNVFHWDQRAAVSPEGVLGTFSWTYDKQANRYLNIRRHVSRDGGQSWVTDELDFSDQAAHPAVLKDGRTVLAWVDRYGSRSIRARAAESVDGRFDAATEVVLYQAAAPANQTSDTGAMLVDMSLWSFGLPYGEALADGDVLVVYYAGEPQRMDIRWARLRV